MAKRKRKITKEEVGKREVKIEKAIEKVKETYDKDKIIKKAKNMGLFSYNKKYRQYEIIIPLEEYEKI